MSRTNSEGGASYTSKFAYSSPHNGLIKSRHLKILSQEIPGETCERKRDVIVAKLRPHSSAIKDELEAALAQEDLQQKLQKLKQLAQFAVFLPDSVQDNEVQADTTFAYQTVKLEQIIRNGIESLQKRAKEYASSKTYGPIFCLLAEYRASNSQHLYQALSAAEPKVSDDEKRATWELKQTAAVASKVARQIDVQYSQTEHQEKPIQRREKLPHIAHNIVDRLSSHPAIGVNALAVFAALRGMLRIK